MIEVLLWKIVQYLFLVAATTPVKFILARDAWDKSI